MKILFHRYNLKGGFSVEECIGIQLDAINGCSSCIGLLFKEELELDVVLAEEVYVLESWAVIERVTSDIAC